MIVCAITEVISVYNRMTESLIIYVNNPTYVCLIESKLVVDIEAFILQRFFVKHNTPVDGVNCNALWCSYGIPR